MFGTDCEKQHTTLLDAVLPCQGNSESQGKCFGAGRPLPAPTNYSSCGYNEKISIHSVEHSAETPGGSNHAETPHNGITYVSGTNRLTSSKYSAHHPTYPESGAERAERIMQGSARIAIFRGRNHWFATEGENLRSSRWWKPTVGKIVAARSLREPQNAPIRNRCARRAESKRCK